MQFAQFGRRGGCEFVAEASAQLFVDCVALRRLLPRGGEDFHQQCVSAFAVWRERDEFSRDALTWGEFWPPTPRATAA